MLYTTVALAIAGLAVTVGSSSSQPECVDKCWLNTQYVSQCGGDVRCLCEDGEFQNAVYQCLYSQCQTSQFGAALHHTLQVCNDQDKHVEEFEDSIAMPTVPALIRQQNEPLKKRAGMQSKSVSNSVSVSNPGRTYPSRGSQSVSASNYQTHSRARPSGGMSASVPYNSRSRAVSGSVLPTWTRNTMSVSANPTRSSSRAMQSVSAQPYYSSSRAMQSVSAQPYYSSSRALHSVSAQPYYSSSRALHSVSAQPYYHSSRAINPVSQISDGQVQAPTAVSYLVSQISDGQVQAPTPTPTSPISQISDGQIQGPTAYPSS